MTTTDTRRLLCDITCGEDCQRCQDPDDERYGWNITRLPKPQVSDLGHVVAAVDRLTVMVERLGQTVAGNHCPSCCPYEMPGHG